MSKTEIQAASQVAVFAQPEIRIYRCNQGHEIQSRYPFEIMVTLGTGIIGAEIREQSGPLCPKCICASLDQHFGMHVIGGIGPLGS